MPVPAPLVGKLRLPVIVSPMFLVSGPELVTACCTSGLLGTFPSLNARPVEQYVAWLDEIEARKAAFLVANPGRIVAPHGVNQIVHKSNSRLAEDVAITVERKVPVVITSVGHPGDIVQAVHGYGGLVFHDVINLYHARKAIEAGVDGIIVVCGGAGGHAGLANPFAMVPQLREIYDGTIILAGALSDGRSVRTAEVLGADFAYMGTRFIATQEANADRAYKQMIVDAELEDVVYTNKASGINGNFLRPSLEAAGIDWKAQGPAKEINMDLSSRDQHKQKTESKAWKDVWSAGQGVGQIHDVPTTAQLVDRLEAEYMAACTTPAKGALAAAAS